MLYYTGLKLYNIFVMSVMSPIGWLWNNKILDQSCLILKKMPQKTKKQTQNGNQSSGVMLTVYSTLHFLNLRHLNRANIVQSEPRTVEYKAV